MYLGHSISNNQVDGEINSKPATSVLQARHRLSFLRELRFVHI